MLKNPTFRSSLPFYSLLSGLFLLVLLMSGCKEEDVADDPEPPTASFTQTVTDLTVAFSNTSENAQAYLWTFGDGESATDKSPTHTYAQGGEYDVKLVVTGATGTTPATQETKVTVTAPDACLNYDGTSPDNLIDGASFEVCDSVYWTVVNSTQTDSDGNLAFAKYAFGYNDYVPTGGEGGAFYIYPDNDASAGEEGTIMYQAVDLTPGQYQLSALVKLAGEDINAPESAMNNYWFQMYLGSVEPVSEADYPNDNISDMVTQVSGWFYGGWTGWAYEVPATDGALVHTYVAANAADEEGKFNVDDAGTYYFVIKFGKGGDEASGGTASFGDGIALDNVKLERVGDVVVEEPKDPATVSCEDFDISDDGNLLKGGNFEDADSTAWSVLLSGQGYGDPKTLVHAKHEFGYTAYSPNCGEGGALYIHPTNDTITVDHEEGTILYQELTLETGDYNIAALVRHGAEDVDPKMTNYWFEIVVNQAVPTEGDGYNNARLAGWIFSGWAGVDPLPAVNGPMDPNIFDPNLADEDGNFTIDTAGTYYFVIKFGKGSSTNSSFGEGIALDELKLTKVN